MEPLEAGMKLLWLAATFSLSVVPPLVWGMANAHIKARIYMLDAVDAALIGDYASAKHWIHAAVWHRGALKHNSEAVRLFRIVTSPQKSATVEHIVAVREAMERLPVSYWESWFEHRFSILGVRTVWLLFVPLVLLTIFHPN